MHGIFFYSLWLFSCQEPERAIYFEEVSALTKAARASFQVG